MDFLYYSCFTDKGQVFFWEYILYVCVEFEIGVCMGLFVDIMGYEVWRRMCNT